MKEIKAHKGIEKDRERRLGQIGGQVRGTQNPDRKDSGCRPHAWDAGIDEAMAEVLFPVKFPYSGLHTWYNIR